MTSLVRAASLIAVCAAMGATSSGSLAEVANSPEIVVRASGADGLGADRFTVQFRDLALQRQSGKTALLHRVGFAIDSYCGTSVASPDPVGAMKCSIAAWDSAKPQLDQILKR